MNHDEFFTFMRDLKKLVVPYECPYKKIRVGGVADGGYVLADLPCDICYSYGSNDEISFENGMYNKYGTQSYVYDHTIDHITSQPDWITFKKQGVSHMKTDTCDTIKSHLMENGHENSKNMVLKMDVEFSEWSVFDTCDVLDKFDQIVVEFHFFSLYPSAMLRVFEKLQKTFKIIHMHANPHQINPYIDIEFPRVLEVSFLRTDLFEGTPVIDKLSTFPDPVLDPVYAIPFPELKWWKRPYDTKAIQLLSEVTPIEDS